MPINVLMTTDDNYISQAKVTIYSVCENTDSETRLDFTILCEKSLDTESRKRLISLEKIFSNIRIKFYEINENDFINAKSDYRVPIASYYRLICAKVIDEEKAIFLDSDLIVEIDINELYNINIENYYIAGVRDITPVTTPNFALWYSNNFNIKDFSDYINCGVLLMNLELIRKENIVERFLGELEKKNLWVDQDIINRVCSGKIHLIDWRFNHITCHTDEEYEWDFGKSNRKSSKEIMHFCGPNKPWGNSSLRLADVWLSVAKKALEKDVYDKLYGIASLGFDYKKFTKIIPKCMETKTVLIIGYSDNGIFVRNSLKKYGVAAKILFCDNDPQKRSLMLANRKVYSIEEAARQFKKAVWVNVVQKQRNQIKEQLKLLEIPEEQIVTYYHE